MGLRTDGRQQHRYQACPDEDCQRYACRIYREGYGNGYGAGHATGEAKGLAEGYTHGYAAGAASCGDG